MSDVAEAIDEEAVSVTFKPPAGATYTKGGLAVPGAAPEPIPEAAAVQPSSGRLLQDLPEGIRPEVSMVGWSRTMVALKWEVVYGGETFRVVHVWPRPADGFCKFAMKRVDG